MPAMSPLAICISGALQGHLSCPSPLSDTLSQALASSPCQCCRLLSSVTIVLVTPVSIPVLPHEAPVIGKASTSVLTKCLSKTQPLPLPTGAQKPIHSGAPYTPCILHCLHLYLLPLQVSVTPATMKNANKTASHPSKCMRPLTSNSADSSGLYPSLGSS